jgi:prolipoprotein diacylglyceryltransferase
VGGLLGGLAGVELMKKRIGERQRSGDLFTYPLLLAMIIGRIGCFSMGVHEETYGTITNSVFGIDLGDGEQRHPVTLYEILFLVCSWIVIFLCEKKYPFAPGARFKIFLISYLVFRFLLDFIKPHYSFPIALSTIQLTCILGLVYYSRDIIKPKKLFTVHA